MNPTEDSIFLSFIVSWKYPNDFATFLVDFPVDAKNLC